MIKHTQTIRRQTAYKLFECVWPFVGLALKGLSVSGIVSFKMRGAWHWRAANEICINNEFETNTSFYIWIQFIFCVPKKSLMILFASTPVLRYCKIENLLKTNSHLPKNTCFLYFKKSPLKSNKNTFYFILKALFALKIFKLTWLFGRVEKMTWLERQG